MEVTDSTPLIGVAANAQNGASINNMIETTDSGYATDCCIQIETDLHQRFSPKYPEYMKCGKRYSSFQQWPKYHLPSKEDLAMSGFVYTGKGDIVFCFCCGIKLKDWEPSDRTWAEHYKHSPSCTYHEMCRLHHKDKITPIRSLF